MCRFRLNMNFLVVGGEGFIGRYLVSKLCQEGNLVRTLDTAGSPDFKVNILDYESLLDATNGMDGVFHLAAVTSPLKWKYLAMYSSKSFVVAYIFL